MILPAVDIPSLHCPKRLLGPVSADPQAAPWPALAATPLRETVSGEPPTQATWFKTAWNEGELRVLFCVEDSYVWNTMTERNSPIYDEEVVEVFLDVHGDLESYFELELNPVNTVLDLVLRRDGDGYQPDFQWQCEGLRTAVQRTPVGWYGEFSIPFKSIGGQPRGTRWRVNFYRVDRPVGVPEELSAWSPTGKRRFHVPQRFGWLEFVE